MYSVEDRVILRERMEKRRLKEKKSVIHYSILLLFRKNDMKDQ